MITDAINIGRIKQKHFQVLRAVFSISYKVVPVLQCLRQENVAQHHTLEETAICIFNSEISFITSHSKTYGSITG